MATSVSGVSTCSDAGPWMATSAVARERSSRTTLKSREAFDQGVAHGRRVGGVGDDHEPLLGQAVDDQIVQHPSFGKQIIE